MHEKAILTNAHTRNKEKHHYERKKYFILIQAYPRGFFQDDISRLCQVNEETLRAEMVPLVGTQHVWKFSGNSHSLALERFKL